MAKNAAIAIIFNPDHQEILLTKRKDIPLWVLPGGGTEENETPAEAVQREVFEETGLTVEIVRLAAEYGPVNRLALPTALFICQVSNEEKPKTTEETSAVAFFPLHELPKDFFHIHQGWFKEVLNHPQEVVRRPLIEITYRNLAIYFLRHPLIVLRALLARLGVPLNF